MSHYKLHLNFESRPNSKEYLLDRCMKVLEMIAVINDKILDTEIKLKDCATSDSFLYYSKDQFTELLKWKKLVKARLQQYYNYRLSLVTKF